MLLYHQTKSDGTVNTLKILIADPDRDFLQTFSQYFMLDGSEVQTAFDGTQVIRKVVGMTPDLVILGYDIPRVGAVELITQLNEKNIPVIAMLREKVNSDHLLRRELPEAYISFPFFPKELIKLSQEVMEKIGSKEKASFDDLELDIHKFMINGKTKVTNGEMNIFLTLSKGEHLEPKNAGTYINSLNNKFAVLGSKVRIKYVMKKGYGMVTVYE